MNVTSNGYYTTQYLDRYRIKPNPRSDYEAKSQVTTPSSPRQQNAFVLPAATDASKNKDAPKKVKFKTESRPSSPAVMNSPKVAHLGRNLPEIPSPVSKDDAPKASAKSRVFSLSPITKLTGKKDKDEVELDDLSENDDLEVEITPAQLNMIQYNQKKDADIRRQLERRKRRHERRQREYGESSRPDIIHGKAYYNNYHQKRKSYNSSSEYSSGDDSSIYYDYEKNSHPKQHSVPSSRDKKKVNYGNYYVTEKKKFDESPFKSKMYTHKTFKEVFQNKNENMDRYNPIDYVFEPTEDPNDNTGNQKLKSAFKTIQSKIGKPNYNDYDYYAQKKKDDERRARIKEKKQAEAAAAAAAGGAVAMETRPSDIFVTNSSDDSDDEALIENLPDEAKQDLKKNKNYKKLWRKKLKLIKKELGQDYIKTYHENINGKEKYKNKKNQPEGQLVESKALSPGSPPKKKSNKIEELDFDDGYNDESLSSDDDIAFNNAGPGPSPAFNPVWNYVLSWLVYDTPAPQVNMDADEYDTSDFSDIEDDAFAHRDPVMAKAIASGAIKAPAPRGKLRKNKKKKNGGMKLNLNGFKKNYKSMVSNWNQPASALFAGDLANLDDNQREALARSLADNKSLVRSSKSMALSSRNSMMLLIPFINQNSEEIELEVPSDFDDDQELYYNPATGALDSMPPTSSDSMKASSGLFGFGSSLTVNSPRNGSSPRQPTGAKDILLHVNSLVRFFPLVGPIFAMIDTIRNNFPHLDTAVLIGELLLFTWCLYLATVMVNAVCTAIQAVCGPIIAIGRLLNRIM